MNLRLALVTAARENDCSLRWLESAEELAAQYSPEMHGRVKIRPRQLVAVDTATEQPTVVWRWFRGVVVYKREDHIVVDNHVYQPAFRAPIGLVRLPDVLESPVEVGDEVFYSLEATGAAIDIARGDGPAHPDRLAADLFPPIVEIYAERRARGEA